MKAYRGSTVAGFPNLFLMLGPNTTLGHSSQSVMIEAQVAYVVDAVKTINKRGLASVEVQPEAVDSYNQVIEKKLDGFGEIVRMLSYEEIGAAAIMSRAVAGAVGTKFIASLPGSRNAVRLAVEKLLVPELAHIVFELRKHQESR